MSTEVLATQDRLARLYRATVGKKAVMAASGIILFLYVAFHMLGNMQVYLGRARMNGYAHLLHLSSGVLWTARVILLVALGLHVISALQLWLTKQAARPVNYHRRDHVGSPISSRTMIWTGLAILCFVIWHVANLTMGVDVPAFEEGDAYGNVVRSFQIVPLSAVYVLGILLLAPHLKHGIWSLTQSLGASDPRFSTHMKQFAWAASVLIAAGFISIPVAVLTGFVPL